MALVCSDSIWGVSVWGLYTHWGLHEIPCPGYEFTTPRNKISFIARRTKVDEHDTNVPNNLKRRRESALIQILAGIGIQDDVICGDY